MSAPERSSSSSVRPQFASQFEGYEDGFRHRLFVVIFLFTIEYIARLACVKHPMKYARSFYGIVDLLSILPTYAAVLMPELHALVDLRLLRLLRMFRLLKLVSYVHEYSMLGQALMASRRKIIIFLSVVAIVVTLNGTLLYLVEGGPGTAFSSIPTAIYFAITSLTTVGFGDIVPQTDIGRAITAFTMLIGWSVLLMTPPAPQPCAITASGLPACWR